MRRALILGLFALFLGAKAAEFWTPLIGAYMPEIGSPVRASGCRLDYGLVVANQLSYDKGDWGEIGADLEEIKAYLNLKQAGPYGEWGLYLPFRIFYGGVLDYVLNPIHQVLNLPTSPPGPPQTYIIARAAGKDPRVLTAPAAGFGDPVVSWGLSGPEGSWGRVSLGIPLGDYGKFMGAGSFRLALVLGWEGDGLGAALQTVVPLGTVPLFADFGQRPTLGAKFWTRLPWDLPGRLEFQANTSPLQAGGFFASATIALRYVWEGFAVSEDLTPGLPDLVLSWESATDCP